jgi:hypothetical protein
MDAAPNPSPAPSAQPVYAHKFQPIPAALQLADLHGSLRRSPEAGHFSPATPKPKHHHKKNNQSH